MVWCDTDLDQLRPIAQRHGATVNDVMLAAVTGVLRDWPQRPWGNRRKRLWAAIPVNARSATEADRLGNWVTSLRVRLPIAEPDPCRRLRAIVAATAQAKRGLQPHVAWAAQQHLPLWFTRTFFRLSLSRRHTDIVISNWGRVGPLSYLDQPVERLVPLMFIPYGHPVTIGIASHGKRTAVGFAVDTAYGDAEKLASLWHSSVEQLAK